MEDEPEVHQRLQGQPHGKVKQDGQREQQLLPERQVEQVQGEPEHQRHQPHDHEPGGEQEVDVVLQPIWEGVARHREEQDRASLQHHQEPEEIAERHEPLRQREAGDEHYRAYDARDPEDQRVRQRGRDGEHRQRELEPAWQAVDLISQRGMDAQEVAGAPENELPEPAEVGQRGEQRRDAAQREDQGGDQPPDGPGESDHRAMRRDDTALHPANANRFELTGPLQLDCGRRPTRHGRDPPWRRRGYRTGCGTILRRGRCRSCERTSAARRYPPPGSGIF